MKSCEEFISPESDYFVYMPSKSAQEMFFYPLQCGHFIYEAGYSLRRESYDSFLLMYIVQGELDLKLNHQNFPITAGSFVLLDCYQLHAYSCSSHCECYWCHFDGVTVRHWYDNIVSRLGNVFSVPDFHPALNKLTAIYHIFASGSQIREPLMSKYLSDLLTIFLLYTPLESDGPDYTSMAEKVIAYINENYMKPISIETLAKLADLSQYHFIRTFKKETGFTPHEYIIHTRISAAKYLLKNSQMPIKDICFNTGFSCESVFCSSFKRQVGMTPVQYRTLDHAGNSF